MRCANGWTRCPHVIPSAPRARPERATIIDQAAILYVVSAITLYRKLRNLHRPSPVRRVDRGQPHKVSAAELEHWCELIAIPRRRRHACDHPGRPSQTRNDLRRSTMEEIGYRSAHFVLDGAIEDRPASVAWLIGVCKAKEAQVSPMIDDEAIALLAERLRTPLQIEQHLTLAFEHGLRCGDKPVTAEVVENRPLATPR